MCYDGCEAETLQSSLVAETKTSRSTETSGFFLREACEAK